ncbi:uncharacterized protein PADG_02974 [Paracoccidioides brasiliensis Pb18]|uniref:Uncharacterized protein n=1 Tax=Paracoccidioides brasiliensis (strain Pb18) TaxID=502780 RepID=C1G719_PARBD|nr:uncharacterized protein PADG_02974 [Paracoccidioides brasiliensis Pb18]EEH46876.1 hypothetical protein PADG_02974 [Paracoccidioides brasiliensis Pb18]
MTSKLDFAANPFTANNYINETAHHPIKLIAATEDAESKYLPDAWAVGLSIAKQPSQLDISL